MFVSKPNVSKMTSDEIENILQLTRKEKLENLEIANKMRTKEIKTLRYSGETEALYYREEKLAALERAKNSRSLEIYLMQTLNKRKNTPCQDGGILIQRILDKGWNRARKEIDAKLAYEQTKKRIKDNPETYLKALENGVEQKRRREVYERQNGIEGLVIPNVLKQDLALHGNMFWCGGDIPITLDRFILAMLFDNDKRNVEILEREYGEERISSLRDRLNGKTRSGEISVWMLKNAKKDNQ